jgi:hypothetical protein
LHSFLPFTSDRNLLNLFQALGKDLREMGFLSPLPHFEDWFGGPTSLAGLPLGFMGSRL